jgi:hypothetical protein
VAEPACGIYLLVADQIGGWIRILLETAARVVLGRSRFVGGAAVRSKD